MNKTRLFEIGAVVTLVAALVIALTIGEERTMGNLARVLFVHVPAGAYLALWFFLQFAYQEPGVAWEAHVGGFIVGVLVTLPLRPVLLGRIRRLHQPATQQRMFR